MRAVAKAKMTRTSPRKISLVAALIRKQSAGEAQVILANTNKDAAGPIALVLDAAIANAENNLNLKKAELVVESVLVGAGPTLKRVRQRSRGQLNQIMKRTSHITIILSDTQSVDRPTSSVSAATKADGAEAAKQPAAKPVETKAASSHRSTDDGQRTTDSDQPRAVNK